MSKKRTKKTTSRKGARRPFKGHGPRRGIRASQARSAKSRRERTAASARAVNAAASTSALALATKAAAKQNFDKTLHAKDSGEPSKPFSSSSPSKPKGKGKRKGNSAAFNAVNAARAAAKKKAAGSATSSAASSKPAKKRTAKKAGKKRSKVMNRRRYKQGRAVTPKFKLMHKWGLPRRGKVAQPKKTALRQAAGDKVTFKQVMDTIRAEKLKGWVCVGPKRTGCGGGSKNLRGGHQIGIYATGHR